MHNKSFTADNQATLIGGRNVGDDYFGAAEGVLFADLDVTAVGPVVKNVSSDFDRYWASESSYPVERILPAADRDRLDRLAASASSVERDPAASAYMIAVRQSGFVHELLAGQLALEWAATRMVSDDPAKGLGDSEEAGLLIHQLEEVLGVPSRDVALVSPYFVTTAAGTEAFGAMARRGVKVRILTNFLDATDVVAVHAGYAKRRKALLDAGVILYGMRSLPSVSERGSERPGPFDSSGSSLHVKTFSVDSERVLVGSFNFDPRSANLNIELGFVIDSPTLAQSIAAAFDDQIPAYAYEVRLSEKGQLYRLEQQGAKHLCHDSEPNIGFRKRSGVFLLSLLPIKWLL
ncbi:phospholipase D-like domain-containing protein [Modicisalibacter xianhensis]|uniref:PLD-like domain-containing protein n=1 Tax=Modicisalibacter xianhensis TaxID=442341 RepID=A0A1I3B0F2_9GAMM|nr:phospholipase D-like domain-containing protein [Halomonas xianhensis]SFH55680.1 PLD-like domain-containing protein [Halomonas xianhensis]